MKQLILFLGGWLTLSCMQAQEVAVLDSGRNISLRGLSVVNNDVFWASGNNGAVARSTNGGKTIQWLSVAGYEKRDFRDIEAFDSSTAIIMAVDNPAVILKTTDAGKNWKKVYERDMPGMFLDAMGFENGQHGICVGDPINSRFWMVETTDGGETWTDIPPQMRPMAEAGEAMFASSGTNLQFLPGNKTYQYGFVSGGMESRLFLFTGDMQRPYAVLALDILREQESRGANSWAVNGNKWFVIGGDYKLPDIGKYNHTYSENAGRSWDTGMQPVSGYKSCVVWMDANNLVACGTSGVDISIKGMGKWRHISDRQFHVVQKARNGTAVYFAGAYGKIGKLKI